MLISLCLGILSISFPHLSDENHHQNYNLNAVYCRIGKINIFQF